MRFLRCDSNNIPRNNNAKAYSRFFCRPCRRYFSVKTGNAMHASNLSMSDWMIAIYQFVINLKGESSLKLHRDLGITQTSGWHMGRRIRAGLKGDISEKFAGVVEVDEAHIGGKSESMSHSRRAKMREMGYLGGGPRVKTHVIGMRKPENGMVRAQVIPNIQASTIQKFVTDHTYESTTVYTDESNAYNRLPRKHGTVNHKARNYVDGDATTNGIESLWAILKRGIHGTYHNISPKHVDRYLDEFVGRHNARPLDTLDQMRTVIKGMEGKQVKFDDLTAYTGENRYTVINEG